MKFSVLFFSGKCTKSPSPFWILICLIHFWKISSLRVLLSLNGMIMETVSLRSSQQAAALINCKEICWELKFTKIFLKKMIWHFKVSMVRWISRSPRLDLTLISLEENEEYKTNKVQIWCRHYTKRTSKYHTSVISGGEYTYSKFFFSPSWKSRVTVKVCRLHRSVDWVLPMV